MIEKIRIDKFLWAVRLFKTRTLAANACRGGFILVNDLNVKASFQISQDDEFTIKRSAFEDKYRVKELLGRRVSAKLVPDYLEYLTTEEELEQRRFIREKSFEKRERGVGRPTKKQRREIDILKKFSS